MFNKISWNSKGLEIRRTISEMKLRSCNVLFIDDNFSNLEEARFYNKDLCTLTPDMLPYLLDHPCLQGNKDTNHERLNQYILLEKKTKAERDQNLSNIEFLEDSDIKINIYDFSEYHLDRVTSLVERSNQLNFTKLRSNKETLSKLINSKSSTSSVVYVQDKFGQYGLCGFYSLENHKLIHFVFSCRIMGMGIESWCYNNLGKPDLKIIDRVSVNLMNFKPHWITEDQTITYKNTIGKPSTKTRILLSGGCDLKQLSNQLEKHFILETEFNYMDANINIRKDHSELILAKHCDELEEIISHIPFISMKSIGSMMFSNFFDAVVISPLMDFHQGCYKHKLSGHIIPKDSFEIDLTDINRLDKTRLHKRGQSF